MTTTLYPGEPSLGVVIGTYGAVAYVHLQLELLKRNPATRDLPILVADDASTRGRELSALCRRYKAEAYLGTKHLGHAPGDLNVFRTGLLWADRNGVDVLVKFSRRWVFLDEWTAPLIRLATETQLPTFSSTCRAYDFGFRTECTGMHVGSWLKGHFVDDVHDRTQRNHWFLPEAFVHQHSAMVLEKANLSRVSGETFGRWKEMGLSRQVSQPHVLWHNCDPPARYYQKAVELGLGREEAEFRL